MFINSINCFCNDTANIWQLVGYILLVVKIVIPILLIIFGMIDLGKAVTSNKEDEIKKSTKSLVRRAIAAVVIFFIPTLVGFIMGLIKDYTDHEKMYRICLKCVKNPTSEECQRNATRAWNKNN